MMHEIEFSLVPKVNESEEWFPRPYPASKELPEWLRSMPLEVQSPSLTTRTVKSCVPFVEALTCGYIIPLAADIVLHRDKDGFFYGESQDYDIVHMHPANQVKGAPFENAPIVKILNPWLIRTPPGHSTLFLPPLNRLETPSLPFVPLAGLVETDNFYREVNFPAMVTLQPGTRVALPKGTPLVQAIPIKREDYNSK